MAWRSVWGRKFYCSNLVQKFIESSDDEPSTFATLTLKPLLGAGQFEVSHAFLFVFYLCRMKAGLLSRMVFV